MTTNYLNSFTTQYKANKIKENKRKEINKIIATCKPQDQKTCMTAIDCVNK